MDELVSIAVASTLIARLTLASVFLPSALGKLRDIHGFVLAVADYQVLPHFMARSFALLLPWMELMIAMLLLTGMFLPFAGMLAVLLFIGFIIAVTINLGRGRSIPCNCHGTAAKKSISWGIVVRNCVLALISLPLVFAPNISDIYVVIASWRRDLAFVISLEGIAFALLLAFFLVIVPLIEWSVDSHLQVARLRKAIDIS